MAPDGYIAHVQGDQTNDFDDYYVKFVSDNGTQSKVGSGTYIEWTKPSIQYELNASTMPHLLIRQANGTFTFEQAEWGDRAVGDLISIPSPSFVGRQISDVFFFQNRLGILAGENVIMSRTSEFFDFFFPVTNSTFVTASVLSIFFDSSSNHPSNIAHRVITSLFMS